MKQIFIDGFETWYYATEDGQIYNSKTKRNQKINKGTVQLTVNGKNKGTTVGKLIAEAFIDNPDNLPKVGHKDGDNMNNRVENLYWMSDADNTKCIWEKRRKNGTTGAGEKRGKRKNIVEKEKEVLLPLEENEKQIVLDNEEIPYAIRTDGRVRNLKKGNILNGTILHTYRYINFRWNNKQKNKAIHQLVANAFIENPNNCIMVDHINGDRLDNDINNLRWVTPKENASNLHKKDNFSGVIDNGVELNEEQKLDEIWKFYKDTEYQVSNYGRVIGKKHRILKGHIEDCGYRSYSINGKRKLAHVLVWETFNQEKNEKQVINHIDGNKLNNFLGNLEVVTHQENMQKAASETNAWNFSRVGEFNDNGELLNIYKNASDAARTIGILPSSMRTAIKRKGKCFNGLTYKYIDK